MSTLQIKNGLLITMNPSCDVIAADLQIVDGRISAIGSLSEPGDDVIDASGCLVLPGFVQTHVHLIQALFRGMGDDMDVVDWLRLRVWPLEQAHDADSVTASARLAVAEMIRSGTTCALTNETVRHTDRVFEVILESGFRACSGKMMMDRLEPGTEMVGEETTASLQQSLSLLEAYHGAGNGRLRYAFCPRGSRNCTEALWHDIIAIAAERNLLIHTHALENQRQTRRLAEDSLPDVAYLHTLGATSPRLVLAHCVWPSPDEVDILAETGTRVTHCPSANLKLASGFAPVPELLARGINVSLGSDGAPCNNNMDMFVEMRLAGLIHKPRVGPRGMPAYTVLEMATMGGARALALDHEIGSLEVGKRADVIVLRRDGLHVQPLEGVDPVAQVVYAHTARDVDTVVIDGQVILRNGEFVALDHDAICAHANEAARAVLARAGLGVSAA
jgi:5-methylthioadenosine/S-adenosylhomocysteine deaminase